jgi:effector-binding domain-containing protein
MTYPCEMSEQSARPTLSIRTRAPARKLPELLGSGYMKIAQYLAELGEAPMGPPFVAYYNMDMEDLDIEFGFEVGKALPGKEEIQAAEIPAGKQASCMYTGPYPQMGGAYEALTAWVRENGYEPSGAAFEFYLNSPENTPPENLQTQIVFPLK